VAFEYACTSIVGDLFRKDKPPNFVALRKNGERESKSRLIYRVIEKDGRDLKPL